MANDRSQPILAGWYVISLRPPGGHLAVRRAAAALGARVLPVSTLQLQATDAAAALAVAMACPVRVFTSPAAVRFAQAQVPLADCGEGVWAAVGSGTAAALRQLGIEDVALPEGRSDSEALLALPLLQSLAGQGVGLVTAPGGRGLIAETLAQRGARLHLAEVYRRLPSVPSPARLALLARLPDTSALLVSSGEAFDNLWANLADADQARLRARPAVASSPRLAVMLAARGFAAIVPARGAVPSQLLAALADDVEGGRFR